VRFKEHHCLLHFKCSSQQQGHVSRSAKKKNRKTKKQNKKIVSSKKISTTSSKFLMRQGLLKEDA
jgi:hypothetical protein